MKLKFHVEGTPRPQGSKRPFKLPNGRVALVEQSKYVGTWRTDIAAVARDAMQLEGLEVTDSPVFVCATFVFGRPKVHYGSGSNAELLKSGAPGYPMTTRTGDLDKLMRALLDAMTHIVYGDDSQVVTMTADKRYVVGREQPHVQVEVVA